MSGRLLTARQVGDLLGVSAETVLRWTRHGELTGYRMPGTSRGRLRYRHHEVEAWIRERATTDGADREAPATRRAARHGLVFPIASHHEATEEDN